MQITNVKMVDFGPHKNIDVCTTSNLVGLLGPNGSGKSNFLDGIKLGLSSTASDNLESYIRDGCDTAVLDIDFRKGGASGKIYRKIGKSPKRCLEWDHQKYTKAEEIEKVLKDILGADKHVLSNAVFVAQGELDKLLFGVQSEREELFIKMMLLSYMAQVSDAADTRLHKLSSTIRDFTVLLDEIRSQQLAAETARSEAENNASMYPDVSKDLEQATTVVNAYSKIEEYTAELKLCIDSSRELQDLLNKALQSIPGVQVKTLNDLHEYIVTKGRVADSLADEGVTHTRNKLAKGKLDGYTKLLMELRESLKNIELMGMPKLIPDSAIAAQEKLVSDIKDKEKLRNEVRRYRADIRNSESIIASADSDEALKESLETQMKELSTIEDEYKFYELKANTLKLALEAMENGHQCNNACPLCDTVMVFSKEELRVKQKTLVNEVRIRSTKIDTARKSISTYKAKLDAVERSKAQNYAVIEACNANIQKCIDEAKKLQDGVLEAEQEELTILRDMRDSAKATHDKRDNIVWQLSKTSDAIAAMPEVDRLGASAYSEEMDTICSKNREDLKIEIDSLVDTYNKLNEINIRISEKEAQEDDLKFKRENAANLVKRTVWSSRCSSIMETNTRSMTFASALGGMVQELKDNQEKYIHYKGVLQQVNKSAQDILKRFSELEKQADSEKIKRRVVDDLRSLKVAFSRQGIPNKYINYKYKRLIDVAQIHLAEMEANFTVRPHPDKPVSFQFMRTDNNSGTYFEQNKLSGGQRVRLTIAVLIAIQQLLVPDLGLLVLDEPSMHVEESGVCALRDLFMTMANRMANNESQIWISDHNDILATAFGTTIHL